MDKIPIIIASVGLFLDVISVIALISTIIGKKSSGFLYVGFGLYLLAALAAFITDRSLIPVLFGLMIFHFAVNLPLKWMNRSR